ncbi:hypothetical protein [Limnohabitans sp. T6-5]|uniref:hypothetical protein n=1 Tax=Limnohabitans sp. T6-5 TaxID=1100724 RepID=UPI0011B22660|nr:hypothetical protein [Limnohabitans sp. T6-5]
MKGALLQEFLIVWRPSLETLLEKHWARLLAAAVSRDRMMMQDIIKAHYQELANQCFFNPGRQLLHRHRLFDVHSLYRFCSDKALQSIRLDGSLPETPHLVQIFEDAFPQVFQMDYASESVGLCGTSCLAQHLSACNHPDQATHQNCDHALIAKYQQFLAHIYTGDQTHPWTLSSQRRHGIPVLVCDTCPQTPFQADQTHVLDLRRSDRQDVLTACQNHIASRLGVKL